MEINFTSGKLAKQCNSEKKLRADFGSRMAEKIMQRLIELDAAETLEAMRSLPKARCHELTGGLKGYLAVDLVHPYRLIFEPDHDPIPTMENGGLDWSGVTAIIVFAIDDYH